MVSPYTISSSPAQTHLGLILIMSVFFPTLWVREKRIGNGAGEWMHGFVCKQKSVICGCETIYDALYKNLLWIATVIELALIERALDQSHEKG